MNSPPLPPHTSTPPAKHRKIKYAKALGYIIDPCVVVEEAVKNGTAIQDQFGRTFATYRNRLAKHCGIKYDDMITVRNPNPDFSPVICVAVATNLSKRSKVPRADILEKAKEFLGTEDEPK
jgi:hypothetical protein